MNLSEFDAVLLRLIGLKDPAGGTFPLPLTAVQLLWINFVADGPPALAMALDRNPGVMERPSRPARTRLLDAASLRFLVVSAAAKASVGLVIIAALPPLGHSIEETRTTLFVYESALQLVFAYPSCRIGARAVADMWVHLDGRLRRNGPVPSIFCPHRIGPRLAEQG